MIISGGWIRKIYSRKQKRKKCSDQIDLWWERILYYDYFLNPHNFQEYLVQIVSDIQNFLPFAQILVLDNLFDPQIPLKSM